MSAKKCICLSLFMFMNTKSCKAYKPLKWTLSSSWTRLIADLLFIARGLYLSKNEPYSRSRWLSTKFLIAWDKFCLDWESNLPKYSGKNVWLKDIIGFKVLKLLITRCVFMWNTTSWELSRTSIMRSSSKKTILLMSCSAENVSFLSSKKRLKCEGNAQMTSSVNDSLTLIVCVCDST